MHPTAFTAVLLVCWSTAYGGVLRETNDNEIQQSEGFDISFNEIEPNAVFKNIGTTDFLSKREKTDIPTEMETTYIPTEIETTDLLFGVQTTRIPIKTEPGKVYTKVETTDILPEEVTTDLPSKIDKENVRSSALEVGGNETTVDDVPVISLDGLFNLTDMDTMRDLLNGTDLGESLNTTSQTLVQIVDTLDTFGAHLDNFFTKLGIVADEEETEAEKNTTSPHVEVETEDVVAKDIVAIEQDIKVIQNAAKVIAEKASNATEGNQYVMIEEVDITDDEGEQNGNSTGGFKISFKVSMSFGDAEATSENTTEEENAATTTEATRDESTNNSTELLHLHELLNITDATELANFLNATEEVNQMVTATNDLLSLINEGFDAIGTHFEDFFRTIGSPVSTQQPLISVQSRGGPTINIPGLLGVNTNGSDGGLLSVKAGKTTQVAVPGLISIRVGDSPLAPPSNNSLISFAANKDRANISFRLSRAQRLAAEKRQQI